MNYQVLSAEENSDNVDYDIRETVRKQIKMDHFRDICSEIIPGFMYLGGYTVAENKEQLTSHGITHVLNCAGDYCQNRFEEDLFYKTYFLKDAKPENIEAVFYETIEFIQKVKEENGKVYVHCVQGVSRSATIVLAYLIFTEKMSYQDAFNLVKDKRGIISPNLGFMVQLMMFHQRIHEDYSKSPIQPKLFAVSRHQLEDPNTIVARLLFDEPLYLGKNGLCLDPRGVFIVANDKTSYLWIGSACQANSKQKFIDYGRSYSKKLEFYERMPSIEKEISQGEEPPEFWRLFGLQSEPETKYAINKLWDNWYISLGDPRTVSSRSNRSRIEYAEREELEGRPTGFLYPNFIEPMYVLEIEDLSDDSFLIVCVKESAKVFMWKGSDFEEKEMTLQNFIDSALLNYFDENMLDDLEFVTEKPHEETEEFLQFF